MSLCPRVHNIFSRGGGEEGGWPRHAGVPFLGEWAGATQDTPPPERGFLHALRLPTPVRAAIHRHPVLFCRSTWGGGACWAAAGCPRGG